jgi:hypothetical protein
MRNHGVRKGGARVIPAQKVRANLGKPLDGMDEPNGSLSIAKKSESNAALPSIRDYLNGVAPVPEVLRIIGEESVRNGTDKLTSEQIDEIIQEARAEKRKG